MSLPHQIETARLVLRFADRQDAAALLPHFDNWNVIRWLTGPAWPVTLADFEAYLEDCAASGPFLEEYRVILLDGMAIGGIGWGYRRDMAAWEAGEPELGYWLGEAYWGQRIMGEAAATLLAALRSEAEIRAVRSGVIDGNIASLRLQERLGFRITGAAAVHARPRGVQVKVVKTLLDIDASRQA